MSKVPTGLGPESLLALPTCTLQSKFVLFSEHCCLTGCPTSRRDDGLLFYWTYDYFWFDTIWGGIHIAAYHICAIWNPKQLLLSSPFGWIRFWWKAHSGLTLMLSLPQGSCCRCSAIQNMVLLGSGKSSNLGGNAPTGCPWVMSNLGPRSWVSKLHWGPLGHGGGVCSCAHVCLGVKALGMWLSCWSREASQESL